MRHLALLTLILGCGSKDPAAISSTATAVAGDAAATLRSEAEAAWNNRSDKAQLQASLQKYEKIVAGDPKDRDALYHLLRGYYFMGDGHETEKDAKLAVWEKAIGWGKLCLALNTDYTALLAKGDEDEATAARAFTKDDVPCAYWISSALGKWAKGSGITVTLRHLPTVKAVMTRVGELDPSYFYNGPDRYWGAYYGAIPSFAGQDLPKSKEMFDKSLAAAPNYLGTTVLLAEIWAAKTGNRAEFERALNWVIAQPADVIPEVKAEAEAEQRKAKALLANIDEYFAN